jgi:hypothetical protein
MHRTWILWCVVVLAILCVLLCTPCESFETPEDTIFVSVASYRDTQCLDTIKDMFAKAKHPARIYAGICEQNTASSKESCVPTEFKFHSNVRRITIPDNEAKGPCYARYLCSTLYRDETYFMQIDSHTTFVPDWDVKAIAALKKCPSEKSVLSGYPHDVKSYKVDEPSVPVLCDSFWNSSGLPQFKAIIKGRDDFKDGKSISIPFMSGGFVFAPGQMVRDVPYDPNLPHLFQGEEILYSARAWTNGYDIFCAPVNIVLHAYYRKDEPKFWTDQKSWRTTQEASETRAKRILGLASPHIDAGSEPYALGTARRIVDYWAFAGLDPAAKTSKSKKTFCDAK